VEAEVRTYGEDDDEKETWIEAGILYVCVKPLDRWEPPEPKLLMAVTGLYIGDFSFEVVWTEYFYKRYH
jgi:hypothetical protein